MADVGRRHPFARGRTPLRKERCTAGARRVRRICFTPALAPGPGLRRHQVDHRNALAGAGGAPRAGENPGESVRIARSGLFRSRRRQQLPVLARRSAGCARPLPAGPPPPGWPHPPPCARPPRAGADRCSRKTRCPARRAAVRPPPARRRGRPRLRPPISVFSGAIQFQSLACRPVTIEPRGCPPKPNGSKLTVEELAARFRGEMIPLTGKFSYFSTLPVAEDDLQASTSTTRSPPFRPPCGRAAAGRHHSRRRTSKKATARSGDAVTLRAPRRSPLSRLFPPRSRRHDRARAGHQGHRGRRLSLPALQRAGGAGGGTLVSRTCRSASSAPSARN